jgi:hypothetical protein
MPPVVWSLREMTGVREGTCEESGKGAVAKAKKAKGKA